jgi:hypothetical protein
MINTKILIGILAALLSIGAYVKFSFDRHEQINARARQMNKAAAEQVPTQRWADAVHNSRLQ